jgi:hypothetical protein
VGGSTAPAAATTTTGPLAAPTTPSSASTTGPARSSPTIAAENARPGTTDWQITTDETLGWIDAYADTTSARVGDTFTLFVDTDSPGYAVTAYRMGWYGGARGRLVWTSDHQRASGRQAAATVDTKTGLAEARWQPSMRVAVTTDWVPGTYLLKLTSDLHGAHYVPLTIRDDDSHADLLFLDAVTTWQAYNNWGACSSYACPLLKSHHRGQVVSFDRPYSHPYNKGSADYLDHELPLIALAEQFGLDITYATDIDLHERPWIATNHHAVVTLGHDEYYSTVMRRALEGARDAGVNLAFFGANAIYRHIRLESSWDGRVSRRMVNFRSESGDPGNKTRYDSTIEWRLPPLNEPEAAVIGIQYQCEDVVGDLHVVDAANWVYRGANVKDGQVLKHLVGNEMDGLGPDRVTPDDLELLAWSPIDCPRHVKGHQAMAYHSVASGAGVFATGTIWWVCALDALCSDAANEPVVRQVTTNVLRAFAAGPAGAAHPSVGNVTSVREGRARSTGSSSSPPPNGRG